MSRGKSTAGQIIGRGPRTFLVRVSMGRDPVSGKRLYHNHTVHGTKEDAQRYLNKILRERDLGTFTEASRMPLNDYLDKWLLSVAKQRVRPRTFKDYEELLARYVRPALGDRPLAKIKPLDVQAFCAGLLERGLSPKTVRLAHGVLRTALESAVKWHLLAYNPARQVELPRQKREEMQVLSPQEARRFMDAAAATRFGLLFEVLLTTGLRPGEALALRWSDLDLEAGRLSVQRALTRTGEFEEPKTARARRTVPLPASTIQALRRHRKEQAEERLAAGEEWQDLGLVFAAENGQPMHHRNLVRRHFKPLLKAAGLPDTLRLYDLRHTCATLLLAAGENPKIVSERLGHASVTLTLDTYSHVLPHMQEQAAAKLESLLYSPGAKRR